MDAQKGCLIAEHIGKSGNYILKESVVSLKKKYSDLVSPGPNTSKKEMNV